MIKYNGLNLLKRYIDSRRVKKVFVGEHQVFGLPPHCVDMGLPSGTLWADCNIDVTQSDGFAASPYQYDCSFFSWGNTDGHNPTSNNAFDYDFGSINSQEPWYDGQVYGTTKGSTLQENIPVNTEYDAAKANLGAPWRMPSSTEFAELFNNVRFINADGTEIDTAQNEKRVIVNSVRGLYLESKINGARLFFSCSGFGDNRVWNNRSSLGVYWSSTWLSTNNAQNMNFGSNINPQNNNNRFYGFAVRPVRDQVEWYGIRWSESLNRVERIGNTAFHRGLPLQSQMRRCVLNDDGTVYKYINNANPLLYEDGTTAHYDGSDGQVMVEIPAYYHESGSETVDGVLWNYIKLYPDTNVGVESKKCYIGAFELIQDNSDNNTAKGCSVSMLDLSAMQITAGTTSINASDVQYLANAATYRNYNYSNVDTTSVKCSYGRPTTGRNRATYRSICARRGTNWSQQSWAAYNSLLRLYFVEYANFNSQTAINNSLTTDGYRQGGLGTGVTNANDTQWSNFNSYNPFVPCGVTIPLGNKTGEVSYTFATDEWAEGVSYTTTVNSYRGIELPFGHIWKFIDGFNRQGGENNTEKIYTCSDVSKFAENDANGYTLISESAARPNGNIGGIVMGEDGTFWPKPGGSTIYGDYFYNAYASGTWYTLYAGGSANSGSNAGLLYLYAYGAGYAYASVGSRLLYTESE